MDAEKFLLQLDSIYEKKDLNAAEKFMRDGLKEAEDEDDVASQITILNEMMGFYRDIGKHDKSIPACEKCLKLMQDMGMEESVEYATTLQNVANAYRAAERLDESEGYYKQVFEIYKGKVLKDDYRYASLYNNTALMYQEKGDFEKSVECLKKSLSIIRKLDDSDIEVATTCVNLGSSLIVLERYEESEKYLKIALSIFEKETPKNFHYSGALSAMGSLLYKEGDYDGAVLYFKKALSEIEINMGKGDNYRIVEENLKAAEEMASISKTGYKKTENEAGLEDQTEICQDAPEEKTAKTAEKIKNDESAKNLAQTENEESAKTANQDTADKDEYDFKNGLSLAEEFYNEYGAKMIHEKFLEYENSIAVGLVGEGSECFGYDDEYSKDHDFGPGFCMYLTDGVYDKIGKDLQKEYEALPATYKGVTFTATKMGEGRRGVWKIGDFYKHYTGYDKAPKTEEEWAEIPEYALATVTNGKVFRDDWGIFTKRRNEFKNEPEASRLLKIAREISAMSQAGQSNYPRAMGRKDYVTANICVADFTRHAMQCVFLLDGSYAPYYKWQRKGMEGFTRYGEIGKLLDNLADTDNQKAAWEGYEYSSKETNMDDERIKIIEDAAAIFIWDIYSRGLVDNCDSNFLGDYVSDIMKRANLNREDIIDEIAKLEFEAFDKVDNLGGRAGCQDDWDTFYIMRKSQYMTWTNAMLLCVRDLWVENKNNGWNMITEKYARMMESTAPEEYSKIKSSLPIKSEEAIEVADQVVEIQVEWMKEFKDKYPKLAGQARDITKEYDSKDNTSYETYLRGELLTYSDRLLFMYGEYIVDLAGKGRNLAVMTMENTIRLEGYNTLEEAEADILQ